MSNLTNPATTQSSALVDIKVTATGVPNNGTFDFFVKGKAVTKVTYPYCVNTNTLRMRIVSAALNEGHTTATAAIRVPADIIPSLEEMAVKATDELRESIEQLIGKFPKLDDHGNQILDDDGNPIIVDRYLELKERCWNESIVPLIEKNRKKSYASKIRKQFERQFPIREQFMLVRVKVFYEKLDADTLGLLPTETQSIIIDSQKEQQIINYRSFVNSKCYPVLENLSKIRKQAESGSNLHGSTVKAYCNAVDKLKVTNSIHFNLSEIDEFLGVSLRVIDDPLAYIDLFCNAWEWFYAQQGLLDEFPYEMFEISREELMEIGQNHENAFSSMVANI